MPVGDMPNKQTNKQTNIGYTSRQKNTHTAAENMFLAVGIIDARVRRQVRFRKLYRFALQVFTYIIWEMNLFVDFYLGKN